MEGRGILLRWLPAACPGSVVIGSLCELQCPRDQAPPPLSLLALKVKTEWLIKQAPGAPCLLRLEGASHSTGVRSQERWYQECLRVLASREQSKFTTAKCVACWQCDAGLQKTAVTDTETGFSGESKARAGFRDINETWTDNLLIMSASSRWPRWTLYVSWILESCLWSTFSI